jgi:lysophospholipase L1-like esterase
MLGTNDTKDRLGMNAACIGLGMERLVRKCMSVDCWGGKKPNVLIIAPPHIGEELKDPCMGDGCAAKSRELVFYYKQKADLLGCHFMDANGCEFNRIDYMHLTAKGHETLAKGLAELVPQLVK